MTTILWHIELSHYSEKVRWALDYKRVAHERRTPLPGLHSPAAMLLTRSRHRRLPVLRIGGQTIGDSTAIVAALEAHHPDPPLYPVDAAERARALELEDYFDEHLAPSVRAYAFHHVMHEPGGLGNAIFPNRPGRRRLLNVSAPLAGLVLRGDYGATAEREQAMRAGILAAADHIERELQPSGYLVGDHFSVADLAGAALFTPLLLPPERPFGPQVSPPALAALRSELEAREAGRWVADMYARHRGRDGALAT